MSKQGYIASLFIAGLIIVLSCRKDPFAPKGDKGPHAYLLQNPDGFPEQIQLPGNPLTTEGIALGKMLFHDPILSGDNTMSCASCHNQAMAFTDNANRFSKGITGAHGNRNSMQLVNLAWTGKFFWDGGAADLESQVIAPITSEFEMNEDLSHAVYELNRHPEYPALFRKAFDIDTISTKFLMYAIAQYERILVSADSKYDQYVKGKASLSVQELKGKALFQDPVKGNCTQCHSMGGLFTDHEYRNNGLDSISEDKGRGRITLKKSDDGKFRTPTLRNIELTAPYMHDGRFNSLEEVLEFYNTGFHYSANLDAKLALAKKGRLSEQDKADIIAFLKTLTDHKFITNPEFKP